MPAARQRSRSPSMALAVSAQMVWWRLSPSRLRITAVASKPSMSGIWQSISTRSYLRFSSASTASRPFTTASAAKPSFCSKPQRDALIDLVVFGEQNPHRILHEAALRSALRAALRRCRSAILPRSRAASGVWRIRTSDRGVARRGRRSFSPSGFAEGGREPEPASLPRFALQPDLTAQQFHQLLRNREAESCSAIFARVRFVHLREGVEQPALLGRRNPDAGVVHRELQLDCVARLADRSPPSAPPGLAR